ELVAQPPDYVLESGSAFAERRSLLRAQFGELRLELEVDALGPVLDGEQRLRRQRLQPRRELARPVRQRSPRVHVREHPLELRGLLLQLRLAGLRLLGDAFEPPLDVVAIRDQELQAERLEVVRRNARPREAV